MIILGIDPGFATIGYGVISVEGGRIRPVDYGTIQTPKDKTFPQRLVMIERGINTLIDTYHPDEIALEELFFNNNAKCKKIKGGLGRVVLIKAVDKCYYIDYNI